MLKSQSNLTCWYLGVLLACLLLYGITCAPGLLWQDSGLIQYRVLNNDIKGFFGLAASHPLYYLLAVPLKYLASAWFPFSVNLLSSLAGAVTVANVFLLVRLWTGAPLPGLVAAASLAVSHTFWRHACIAETYTLWAALFTVELMLFHLYLQKNKTGALLWAGLVNGLALSVHLLAIPSLLVFGGSLLVHCAQRRLRLHVLAKVAGLWFLGALPILTLVFQQVATTGEFLETFHSLLFGKQWQGSVLNTTVTWDILREGLFYIGLNFPSPILMVGVLGWVLAPWTKQLRLVFVLGVLYFVFAFRYTVPDRYAFFIPFYILSATVLGWASHQLLGRHRERGLRVALVMASLSPVLVYTVLPPVLTLAHIELPTRGDVPHRDDRSYFLTPWKMSDRGAMQFATEALGQVGPEAVIFADLTTVPPLLLLQQLGPYRQDVHVISAAVASPQAPPFNPESLRELVHTRPVYVVSNQPGYCPAFVRARYDLRRRGVLWRVVARGEGLDE